MMRLARLAALALIFLYQKGLSPFFPPSCRFAPTCSDYGKEAIRRYGLLHGGWLLAKRLARCQPFCKGGIDRVPERRFSP